MNQNFGLGLKAAFSTNLDTVTAIEPAVFFRYYLPLKLKGLFVQAEAGMAVFFEDEQGYPAFLGGVALGWRINLGKIFYIEPMVRGGYPFIWGGSLQAGTRFEL